MAIKLLKSSIAILALGVMFAGGYIVRATRHAGPAAERRILYYVDPMHPAYRSDKPGTAPDCGMALEPVYADDAPTVQVGARQRSVPPGAIRIAPERQQLIGVKFATVELGGGARAIRTVGKVSADERRIGHVHTRIEGWIDKMFVDFTGDLVKKDEPMLTIYSPEMLASQTELLLAARARDIMPTLFDAAKRRLELWDLSDDQIDQVLRTNRPIRSVTVHAPMSGFVTERNVFPNQRVTPDSDLYTITDLSRVWIVADVFESDSTAIEVGDSAYVMFAAGAAAPVAARVSYILPEVDPVTRTLKVRLDAPNPGTRMKPDMFVNVEFGVAGPAQLTVPADAVLDTGDRQTVFVDLGNGYLEPRQVTIGSRFGDRVTVVGGLSAGERVVSSGTFLVDSESQLKAAANGMGAPTGGHERSAAPGASHEGHDRD